ncbi:MAG: phosphopyruvate hydratase [Deltaproteobacteria bacterium]|nr:phosphopyruvate hydratase [Deltaproteobacteria bacterium]
MRLKIQDIQAREVLDSRGFPTIEAELLLKTDKDQEYLGRAIVPSGASTGEGEALELRDGDKKRYLGKGVLLAVQNVREKIKPNLIGKNFTTQFELDSYLKNLDGTENKSKLGANAILSVSLAYARAEASSKKLPLYSHLASLFGAKGNILPVPLMNILNGGRHADNGLAVQEFMIVPCGFQKFSEALRAGTEVFHNLKKILQENKLSTGLGDEGGFAPAFQGDKPHEQVLQILSLAIEKSGYRLGTDIFLALDAAASEFCADLPGKYRFEGKTLSYQEMTAIYQTWMQKYSIISIEDGLSEHDWEGWGYLTKELGSKCQLVGDDLFVTNSVYLKKGIEQNITNAILIKLNQIGTIKETFDTMKLALQAGYKNVISHRSGETEDTFIADLAVGTGASQIKTGSASRTDRIAKYNQLLRIEEQLGSQAIFLGRKAFEKV